MSLLKKIKVRLPQLWRKWQKIFRTQILTWLGKSDADRWAKAENLYSHWNQRTETLASWVEENARVLEFGAGKLQLEPCLKEGVVYMHTDIVARREDTLVCDLNLEPLPDFPKHDYAVFSGVIEYLHKPEKVLEKIRQEGSHHVVGSYAHPLEHHGKFFRQEQGWVNVYSKAELDDLFEAQGYRLVREEFWEDQRLFHFLREQ